jgi:hypothetical protein
MRVERAAEQAEADGADWSQLPLDEQLRYYESAKEAHA